MTTDARLDPCRTRLSVENAAMLLIDHQEGFFPGITSIPTDELRNNIVALAKVAARTGMPSVLTSSFAQGIKRAEDACILRMNNAGCIMTTWVSVAAELLHDHLGPHKEPIQSVFNEHLFGYASGDASGMARAA